MDKNNLWRAVVVTIMMLTATACVRVGVTQLKPRLTAKADDCELEVFAGEVEIKRPFETVCLIDVKAFGGYSGEKVLQAAKPRACACGADGLLISRMGTERQVSLWADKSIHSEDYKVAQVRAIRFTDRAGDTPAGPAAKDPAR